MENKVIDKLALLCSAGDPQDAKILLLATLVDQSNEVLNHQLSEIKDSLVSTQKSISQIEVKLEGISQCGTSCPIVGTDEDTKNILRVF